MLLDALGIPFESIDITKPEKIDDRNFMKENAKKEGSTKPPLPPQFFYNDEYLGVKNLNEFFLLDDLISGLWGVWGKHWNWQYHRIPTTYTKFSGESVAFAFYYFLKKRNI